MFLKFLSFSILCSALVAQRIPLTHKSAQLIAYTILHDLAYSELSELNYLFDYTSTLKECNGKTSSFTPDAKIEELRKIPRGTTNLSLAETRRQIHRKFLGGGEAEQREAYDFVDQNFENFGAEVGRYIRKHVKCIEILTDTSFRFVDHNENGLDYRFEIRMSRGSWVIFEEHRTCN